jgi:protein TonB
VLSTEPRADEPVDLTSDVFVVGTAPQYAGGTTSPAGTGPATGRGGRGEPASGSAGGGPPDLSRPVSLPGESWSCPWPTEAEPLAIDEQAVLIRVVARADGTVEAVTVASDPGHGFAAAAADCARRARFLPARGPNGETVRAQSPPLRVRFSR